MFQVFVKALSGKTIFLIRGNFFSFIYPDVIILNIAGESGQELNMASMAVEVGVDTKTIQSWIGI